MTLFHITDEALVPVSKTFFESEALQERRDIQRLIKNHIAVLDKICWLLLRSMASLRSPGVVLICWP